MHASVPPKPFEPWKHEARAVAAHFETLLPTGQQAGFTSEANPPAEPEAGSVVAPEPVSFNLEAARQEAAEIVAAARVEAATLIAEQTAQAIQEERTIQRTQFAQVSQDLLTNLEKDWRRYQEIMERETAAVVVEIARQILQEHFEADPQAILPTVREAVRRLSDSSRVQVIIHPHHEAATRQAQEELLAFLRADSRLEITVSDEVEVGGCLVQGDHGSLDARLETRLTALDRVIGQVLSEDKAA